MDKDDAKQCDVLIYSSDNNIARIYKRSEGCYILQIDSAWDGDPECHYTTERGAKIAMSKRMKKRHGSEKGS